MQTKVESYETACALLGRDPEAKPEVSKLPEDEQEFIIGTYEVSIIIQALNYEANGNKKWVPDYSKNTQKYEPTFNMRDKPNSLAGSGFSCTHCDYWFTCSVAGSRFCYINYDIMRYAVEKFQPIYKKIFLQNEK